VKRCNQLAGGVVERKEERKKGRKEGRKEGRSVAGRKVRGLGLVLTIENLSRGTVRRWDVGCDEGKGGRGGDDGKDRMDERGWWWW
jgi:hypothetical protein